MIRYKETMRVKHRFSADEAGWETLAIAVRWQGGDDLTAVLQVTRDEAGQYYFGIFCDFCDDSVLHDREAFLRFLEENETNGYSCGSYDSVEEINAALQKCGGTQWGIISAEEI